MALVFLNLGIIKPLIAAGFFGVVIIDYGLFLRFDRKMEDKLREVIKSTGLFILILVGVLTSYMLFSLSIIFGAYVYGITQLGLLLALFWPSLESWLVKYKWFLSPTAVVGSTILFILMYAKTHSYNLKSAKLSLMPQDLLPRMIWEKSLSFCRQRSF
jgi:hypothetical protein